MTNNLIKYLASPEFKVVIFPFATVILTNLVKIASKSDSQSSSSTNSRTSTSQQPRLTRWSRLLNSLIRGNRSQPNSSIHPDQHRRNSSNNLKELISNTWNSLVTSVKNSLEYLAIGFDLIISSIFILVTDAMAIAQSQMNPAVKTDTNVVEKILPLLFWAFFYTNILWIVAILIRKYGWDNADNNWADRNKLNWKGILIQNISGFIIIWHVYVIIKS